jgi:hypothetical protein
VSSSIVKTAEPMILPRLEYRCSASVWSTSRSGSAVRADPVGSPTQTASGTVEQATQRRGWNSRAERSGVGDSLCFRASRQKSWRACILGELVSRASEAASTRLGAGDQLPGELAVPRERFQEESTWPARILELTQLFPDTLEYRQAPRVAWRSARRSNLSIAACSYSLAALSHVDLRFLGLGVWPGRAVSSV